MSYRIEQSLEKPNVTFVINPMGVHYEVSTSKDGNRHCNCPSYKFGGKGTCKHIQMLGPSIVGTRRYPRDTIFRMADSLSNSCNSPLNGFEWLICGSWRRGLTDCKDLDIVILVPLDPEWMMIIERLNQHPGVKIGSQGMEQVSGEVYSVPFDLTRCSRPNEWWYYILYRTGSKQHNILMRKVAKSKGWLLNQHGISGPESSIHEKAISPNSEQDIFTALGMDFLTPSER